jgi:hypothetical protein
MCNYFEKTYYSTKCKRTTVKAEAEQGTRMGFFGLVGSKSSEPSEPAAEAHEIKVRQHIQCANPKRRSGLSKSHKLYKICPDAKLVALKPDQDHFASRDPGECPVCEAMEAAAAAAEKKALIEDHVVPVCFSKYARSPVG